jgi:hypothetical protein
VVEVKDTKPNPNSEYSRENIEKKLITDAYPTPTVLTTKIQPNEPANPKEWQGLFHSQMWVKGTPLHLIVDKNI